jgi:biopolymer transport protein ExbD
MRLRSHHHPAPTGKINVTPLIDVVMVLIVFYLIVGKLAADRKVEVALPPSAIGAIDDGRGEREPIVITVSAGENAATAAQVMLDGALVTDVSTLQATLKGLDASSRIVQLRADKGLKYELVSPVLEACRGAGVASVKLATRRTGNGGEP